MRLAARNLKVSAVLDGYGLVDPGNKSRVLLAIDVGGKVFTSDISAKSVRKAKAVIAEHGPDNVSLLIQGRLEGSAIVEAGLVAQPKLARKAETGCAPMRLATRTDRHRPGADTCRGGRARKLATAAEFEAALIDLGLVATRNQAHRALKLLQQRARPDGPQPQKPDGTALSRTRMMRKKANNEP